jgi:hypothetical protein
MTKKDEKTMISATPLGRRGNAEEVANVYISSAPPSKTSYVENRVSTSSYVDARCNYRPSK